MARDRCDSDSGLDEQEVGIQIAAQVRHQLADGIG